MDPTFDPMLIQELASMLRTIVNDWRTYVGERLEVAQAKALLRRVRREYEGIVVEVLCGQALADHLGDVRDEERKLWQLIGVVAPVVSHDSAWENTKDTLRQYEIPLPFHLRDTGNDLQGLCGDRTDHEPHLHDSDSLGTFWCHADQSQRLPYAAERQRNEKNGT